MLGKGSELEYIVADIWTNKGKIKVANFYNPCSRLTLQLMDEIAIHLGGKVILCGDFNAHSSLWGH